MLSRRRFDERHRKAALLFATSFPAFIRAARVKVAGPDSLITPGFAIVPEALDTGRNQRVARLDRRRQNRIAIIDERAISVRRSLDC